MTVLPSSSGTTAPHAFIAALRRMPMFHSIGQSMATWRLQRELRRTFFGMEPRLLRDIGIDPGEIYDRHPRMISEVPGYLFHYPQLDAAGGAGGAAATAIGLPALLTTTTPPSIVSSSGRKANAHS